MTPVFLFSSSTENVSTNVATDIYFPKMAGEEVMVASSMKVNFSLTHMRVYLDNLFNGNKVLGKFCEGALSRVLVGKFYF